MTNMIYYLDISRN